jgi:DNA-binding response OmpR family regulator
VEPADLRRKLEANPSAPELIKIERGAGYLFSVLIEVPSMTG